MKHEVKFGIILTTTSQKYSGISIHMETIIDINSNRVNVDMEDIKIILESIKYRLIGHFVRGIDEEIKELKETYG